ncbi:unnamed protein product [Mytilus coruscus]|uniref:Reverse transcriptase RNase H-like domain-containing protein n=1 Tax=Mytilus coruscus TaxID=42192 RepID=A0A6J8C967_MYTCO|nr:unnamed protein product [Mytilus coruscus]
MKTLSEEEQVHALRRKNSKSKNQLAMKATKKGPIDEIMRSESRIEFQLWKSGTTHERRNCPRYDAKQICQHKREFVGVLFGLERFNDYTYMVNIYNVESDHKPLEMIVRKSLGCAPPRLQRIFIEVTKYDFSLAYTRRDLVVPDMLSRSVDKDQTQILKWKMI